MSNSTGSVAYVSIPIFVAGIIKYAERTWVLRSSSANNFTESLRTTPEFDDKHLIEPDANPPTDLFCEADYFFKRFKFIFTGLFLPLNQITNCVDIISKKEAEDAFKTVAIELGFMYDKLYTKATLAYSKFGILLRCVSSASTICALAAFIFVVDTHPYPIIDTIITYLLLVGAICLEFYAFIMLSLSDRTYVLVAQQKLPNWIPHCSLQNLSKRKRWSGSMPQLSLMDIILKSKMNNCVQKSLGIIEDLQNRRLCSRTDVTTDVQNTIFTVLIEKSEKIVNADTRDVLSALGFDAGSDSYDQELLIYHIVTELWYHDELSRHSGKVHELDPRCKVSKCLSDYLLYLLVMRPSMLAKGGRDTWYRETCDATVKYFEKNKFHNTSEACKELLEKSEELGSIESQERKGNSALAYGCHYAKLVKDYEDKWEKLSRKWVELLIYFAIQCGWKEHGQQLTKGGEFLTHVSLLMAHLGLCQQYSESYSPISILSLLGR